jgi:hypothetical protein
MSRQHCSHRDSILIHERPHKYECPECVALGDTWVHLRQCTACGHVGCCDSSKNRHATRHWQSSSHPIIRSLEDGWLWCYEDDILLD